MLNLKEVVLTYQFLETYCFQNGIFLSFCTFKRVMKRKLMFLMTFLFIGIGLVTAQTSRVTGLVTSEEDGQPVVGASILVNGTTLGTITDIDGKFTITNVPSSAKTY